MTINTEDAVQANQQARKNMIDAHDAELRHDPAADLTALFENQAHAYAVARSSLDVDVPPQPPQPPRSPQPSQPEKKSNLGLLAPASDYGGSSVVSGSTGSISDARTDGEANKWHFLLDNNSSIRVDRGIDPRILYLVWPDIQHDLTALSFPTKENGLSEGQFTAGLNTALRKGDVLWTIGDLAVVGLGPEVVVKIGSSLDEDGITNLEYIKENVPRIPIPAVLGAFTYGRRSFVFMTRGRGVTLEALWPDLSVSDKRDVQDQLNQIFRDLRATPAPAPHNSEAPHIGSFVSAVCKDTRRGQRVSSSTMIEESALNDFLVTAPPPRSTPAHIRMLRPAMRDDHAIVMTHADLHPRNIMVEWVDATEAGEAEPGKADLGNADLGHTKRCMVTCILDWEMAGWYPAYWEYVKAMCNASPRGPLADWPEYMPTDAIGTWPVEYALDSLIGRWLG